MISQTTLYSSTKIIICFCLRLLILLIEFQSGGGNNNDDQPGEECQGSCSFSTATVKVIQSINCCETAVLFLHCSSDFEIDAVKKKKCGEFAGGGQADDNYIPRVQKSSLIVGILVARIMMMLEVLFIHKQKIL